MQMNIPMIFVFTLGAYLQIYVEYIDHIAANRSIHLGMYTMLGTPLSTHTHIYM